MTLSDVPKNSFGPQMAAPITRKSRNIFWLVKQLKTNDNFFIFKVGAAIWWQRWSLIVVLDAVLKQKTKKALDNFLSNVRWVQSVRRKEIVVLLWLSWLSFEIFIIFISPMKVKCKSPVMKTANKASNKILVISFLLMVVVAARWSANLNDVKGSRSSDAFTINLFYPFSPIHRSYINVLPHRWRC